MLPTEAFNINKVAYLKSNSLRSLIRFTVLCLLKSLKAIVLIWASCCRVPNFHPFPCFSWESPLGRQTAKKLCEGMEKGSMKAGNSEKSSYRYAILFFSLKLLLLLRNRLESSSYQKKKRKAKAKMCRKIWQNLGIHVTFPLIYLLKRLKDQVISVIVRRQLSSLNIPVNSVVTAHFN